MKRLLIGFILSPIVVLLPFSVIGRGYSSDQLFFSLKECFSVMLPVAYALAVLIGIPVWWLFLRKRWLSWWHAGLAGVIIATPLCILLIHDSMLHTHAPDEFVFKLFAVYGISALIGFLISLTFWLLAVRNNPIFKLKSA